MQKIILMILVVILSLNIGCEKKEYINLTINKVIIHTTVDNEHAIIKSSYNYKKWAVYLKKNYNIIAKYHEYAIDLLENRNIDGVLILSVNDFINLYKTNDNFEKLNKYIENNETMKKLPENIKTFGEDKNGDIRCIPTTDNSQLIIRLYNKKMIDDMDLNIPNSLDEFTELVFKVKKEFPEKSVIEFNDRFHIKLYRFCVSDLFFSQGVPSLEGMYFNIDENQYNNILQNKYLKKSLEYISFLHENEILKYNTGKNSELPLTYLGSEYSINDDIYFSQFKNPNNEFIQTSGNIEYVMCILKSSKDIDNQISNFINTFYGDSMSSMIGSFGIPGLDYEYNDNSVWFSKSVDIKDMPAITAFNGNFIKWCRPNTKASNYYSEAFYNNQIYHHSLSTYLNIRKEVFNDNLLLENKIKLSFYECFYDMIDMGLLTDEIIAQYKKISDTYKFDEYIAKANNLINNK